MIRIHLLLPPGAVRADLRRRWLAACLVFLALSPAALEARGKKDLPERYQQWLEEVSIIIQPKERKQFLKLERDYQRDAFIRRFWKSRDPDPETADNRFKGQYLARLAEAKERFRFAADERRTVYTLNGEPAAVEETSCGLTLWPIEIWSYGYSENAKGSLTLIFYQRGSTGPFRLWHPAEGFGVLVQTRSNKGFTELMYDECTESFDDIERLLTSFRVYENSGDFQIRAATRAPQLDPEWLGTFRAFSTELEEGEARFETKFTVDYPGVHQQRVVVRGILEVPRAEAQVVDLSGRRSYNFSLTGEILTDQELFDSFKYVFDVPEAEVKDDAIPLIIERWLRPGEYALVVKVEDLHGGAASRVEKQLKVPTLSELGAALRVAGDGSEVEEVDVATSLELVSDGKDLQRGYARFAARVTGENVAKVRFFLEDRPVLTKNRPPYSVDLDLGRLPETMTVRAVALDASGRELATDEILLNPGEYAFGIGLIEPRWGSKHAESVEARAAVQVPAGGTLDRVEFYRDDLKIATLYQEPFTARIPLEHEELVVIRALAVLDDGNSTEDLAILNGADYLEKIDVRMIEVFASVLDRQGAPLAELERDAFQILEDGAKQEILRFERLENLPIYAGLLIDTSASMIERIGAVRDAAVRFLEQAIRPQDRAAIVTFANRPRLATGFTADVDQLSGALAGIKAGEGTALYDSILFALYNFRGLKGQRALLVLSDGEDRRSKATFEEAREFALASGVSVYTVGIEKGMSRKGKSELSRLAEETGGRAFLIDSVDELDAIYDTIQTDLRSKYFLAYQPAPAEDDRSFRAVEVLVRAPGAEVRALRGYVPR